MESTLNTHAGFIRRGHPYQVHGSGVFAPARALWSVMATLTDQAQEPIQATYRASGGGTAGAEFTDYAGNVAQYNHFYVGDRPLTSGQWEQVRSVVPTPICYFFILTMESLLCCTLGDSGPQHPAPPVRLYYTALYHL